MQENAEKEKFTIDKPVTLEGNTYAVIQVNTNEFDLYSSPEFIKVFDFLSSEYTFVIVDMSGVTYLDSTCFAVLIRVHKILKAKHGRLILLINNPKVLRLFKITGIMVKMGV